MFLCTVKHLVLNLPVVHHRYGYVSVNRERLVQLPKPIVWRVLNILAQFVSGELKSTKYRELSSNWNSLLRLDKAITFRKAIVCPVTGKGKQSVYVCGIVHPLERKAKVKSISVGETLLWNKWEIKLNFLSTSSKPPQKQAAIQDKKYFVRNYSLRWDSQFVRRGVRVVRSAVLPPVFVRANFPVIIDESDQVVAIPHFKYLDRRYGVTARVEHKPPLSLDFIINQHEEPIKDDL